LKKLINLLKKIKNFQILVKYLTSYITLGNWALGNRGLFELNFRDNKRVFFPYFKYFTSNTLTLLIAVLFVGSSVFFANYAIANVISIDVGLGPRDASINHITNKVYVSNQFDDTVSVIDGATDTVIKTISVTEPGKSAVNPNTNKIYIISDNDVVIIDGSTDTEIAKIFFVGIAPNSVAIDLDTNKIYVSARISNHVAVIDGNTNTKLTPIDVGDTPVSVVFNPGTDLLYVALNADLAVDVIDVSTNTVINTIPIDQVGTVGHGPFELILNTKDDILYVNNCHIGRFPGVVSVVDIKPGSPNENSIIDNIAVEAPGDGSYDPDTDRLYVATQEGNTVAVIDTTINEIIAELPGGEMTIGATLNHDTKKLYALNYKTKLDFPQTPPTDVGTVTVLDVTNVPPSSNAGTDQTVNEATLVTLNGGQSSDSNGDPLTFSWKQISGPTVTLTGADTVNPTFTAPNVNPQKILTFELTVSDGTFEVKDRVNVLVMDVNSFDVALASTADGVAGDVDVGDVQAGDQIILQYQTPAGILPNAELQQELITSGVAGNDVSFTFDIRSDVPAGLPPLPVSSALFFDINVENLDLSDPSNFSLNIVVLFTAELSIDLLQLPSLEVGVTSVLD